jgi:hypothetical protein
MKQTTTDLQNKTKIRPQLTRSEHNLEIPFWIVPELEEHPLLLTERTNKANRHARTGPTTMIKRSNLQTTEHTNQGQQSHIKMVAKSNAANPSP